MRRIEDINFDEIDLEPYKKDIEEINKMGFELKPSTKFEDILNNCKVLREQYTELLTPFFNASAIKCWKSMIYSLNISYWKLDKLWEYLNDDINLVDFVTSVKK